MHDERFHGPPGLVGLAHRPTASGTWHTVMMEAETTRHLCQQHACVHIYCSVPQARRMDTLLRLYNVCVCMYECMHVSM